MTLLKSIFISVYFTAIMVLIAVAGLALAETKDYLSWGGVLLVCAPLLAVISWLLLFKNVARTSARFPMLNVIGIVGVTLSFVGYTRGGNVSAVVLAFAGWVGFLLYAYWYSSYGRRPSPRIKIGQRLPEFALTNVDGEPIRSTALTDKPTIWMFYRGNWCPLCMAQVKELVGKYQELAALGVRVALVSPQPHTNTLALAKKFGVQFDFLTDDGNQAGHALGIANPNGLPMGMQALGYASDTVLPTVVITDAGGCIRWVHETDNYRVRPEPEVYLDVLRAEQIVSAAA